MKNINYKKGDNTANTAISGIDLIKIEREEQIEKHGYTAQFIEDNPVYYDTCQMAWMAEILLSENKNFKPTPESYYPANWPKQEVAAMLGKSYKERLVIAGALIAAEIDRLNSL